MFLLLCLLQLTLGSVFVVEQAPSTQKASLHLLSTTGKRLETSKLTFTYPAPLVETTVNPTTGEYYIITYPTSAKGAVLYELGSDLHLQRQWDSPPFQFFDLQFCLQQNTLFGIYVSSRYGRVLSNFTVTDSDISVKQYFTLPYMWYVNASSFDQRTSTYFALLNNFPGQPNSTTDQQLAVAHFGLPVPSAQFFPLVQPTGTIFKFLAWSHKLGQLFGLALGEGQAILSVIDTASGNTTQVASQGGVRDIGPSFVDDRFSPRFCSFVSPKESQGIDLLCWSLTTFQAETLRTWESTDLIFAAATFWDRG
jgi:hypothetical protein